MSFPPVSNRSRNYPRLEQNEIWLSFLRFSWRNVPFAVYIVSRLALIQLNEAEFTDGYKLLTWRLDHPVRWHPLYPLLIKTLATAIDPVIAGRLISVASGLLAMVVLTRIAAGVYGERAATITAWLYVVSPLFFWCNLRVLSESTFQFLFCLSIHLLLSSLRREKPLAAPAFIFVSGLAGLTRPEGFVLFPAVVYILVQVVIHNKTSRVTALSLAGLFSWLLCLGWSFAISSSDSYSNIFVHNISEFKWGYAFQRLISYIEVYPYVMFYPFFIYGLFNIGGRPAVQTWTWKYLLLYFHAVFAIMLFLHPAWSTRFLLIPVSLLLVEASAGLSLSRLTVKTILIVACFIFSIFSIYFQKGMFADFKNSAIAIKKISGEHRVISDEKAKTEYYLGKPVIPYKSNVDLQPGDLLVLHSFITDLTREKEILDARYAYRALLSEETSVIPLLANTAVAESEYSNSPVVLLRRFHKQRFQSVVLMIDQRKHEAPVRVR